MIRNEDVYKIGRIGKPHGVKGELTIHIDDDVFDRVDADYLILMTDGLLVPFYMEEYRFRTDNTVLVKFDDIDTMERAAQLTNCDVYFPRHMADNTEDEYTWAFFVGFTIIDGNNGKTVGRIASVDDSTQNILFCMENNRLIPAAEELITDVDKDHRTITINIPEGLLEL